MADISERIYGDLIPVRKELEVLEAALTLQQRRPTLLSGFEASPEQLREIVRDAIKKLDHATRDALPF